MKNALSTKLLLILFSTFLLTVLTRSDGLAQKQDPRWLGPFQLTAEGVEVVANPQMVADSYGFVHAFWAEQVPDENRYVVNYARFDGTAWSIPVDIYVGKPDIPIGFIFNPLVTKDGKLHLFWTLSQQGPVVHLSASVSNALNAKNWTLLSSINVNALNGALILDSNGIIHMMVTALFGENLGLFYTHSDESRENFTTARWLDPDIPPDYGASTVAFAYDDTQGHMYVVWRYMEISDDGSFLGKQVNYLRSIDGGKTWIDRMVVDVADEDPFELRADGLLLEASNGQVHIIWAGVNTTHREEMYSLDGGDTWKGPLRIFGNLKGEAIDSIVSDGGGIVHFLGQIRYPQGLYEITWDGTRWGIPRLVYLIALSDKDPIGDRIHIHNVRAAVRRGNQLVIMFTNSPLDPVIRLYSMHRTLEDIAPQETEPIPLPSPTVNSIPTAEPVLPESTPAPTLIPFNNASPEPLRTPGFDLSISILVMFVVVTLVLLFRLVILKRR